jgi:hypothetical protein
MQLQAQDFPMPPFVSCVARIPSLLTRRECRAQPAPERAGPTIRSYGSNGSLPMSGDTTTGMADHYPDTAPCSGAITIAIVIGGVTLIDIFTYSGCRGPSPSVPTSRRSLWAARVLGLHLRLRHLPQGGDRRPARPGTAGRLTAGPRHRLPMRSVVHAGRPTRGAAQSTRKAPAALPPFKRPPWG